MNGNNRQPMGAFVDFPEYDLSRASQRQALPVEQPRGLVSMGQLMDGGGMSSREGMPMPAMMPQEQLPQQQDYGNEGQPQGKKILGMPKDQFIALMGTIAQAFGGDSPSGRMGAGLINMANMMREERMGKGRAQAEATKEKRDAAAKERQRLKEKKEKIPSQWESFYTEKKGQINPKTKRPFTEAEINTDFKKIGAKRPTIPKGQAGLNEVNGVLHKGFWHLNSETGEYIFAPTRIATGAEKEKTKAEPPAGEKPPTHAEKRAQRKELRNLESTVRGVDPKTGKANIEYEESQISVDAFNELSDRPYVLRRVPGTPEEEKSFAGIDILRPDVPATPATLEEVPISQFKIPEEIMSANYLSEKAKRRLLLKKFPKMFE